MARRDAQEVLDDTLCSDPPGGRLAARYLWIQMGVYGTPLRRFCGPGNGSATDPLIGSLLIFGARRQQAAATELAADASADASADARADERG